MKNIFFLFIAAIIVVACSKSDSNTPEKPPVSGDNFFEDFDGTEINNEIWQVATWKEHGGQTGRERCFVEDGYLKMHFINSSTDGFLSSAIQTRDEFLYGKWEARIKPSNVPGILNSFYTIDWNNENDNSSNSNGTKQEIDIEFLTYVFGNGEGKVHYAVHESGKASFETNPDVDVSFDPSSDFHVWGFEITPEYIEWFVDDTPLKRYTYAEGDISINATYQIKLNAWSQEHWVNGPPAEDVVCEYLIDWIKFTPRNTSK